ncbi:MAG: prolyl oligopeptidase family serine peptidase [Chthonomonadales bacterium]
MIRSHLHPVIGVITFACLSTATLAQRLVPTDFPKTEIPFERFYQTPSLAGAPPTSATWAPDSKHAAFLWNKDGSRHRDIYVVTLPGGTPVRLTDYRAFSKLPLQDDERTEVQKKEEVQYDTGPSGIAWSPDSRSILFGYKGSLYEAAVDGKTPIRLRTQTQDGTGNYAFSPNGKFISYSRASNVYLLDRATGDVRQLTTVSKPSTGVTSYVWSPDSANLLVTWSDSSGAKSIIIPDYTKELVEAGTRRRNLVGQSPNVQRVGVVSVSGGLIKWVDGLTPNFYNQEVAWSPDGKRIALSEMGGDFKSWRLRVIEIDNLKPMTIANQKTDRFINDWRPCFWSRDGRYVYYGTDTDGWRHVYRVRDFGGDPELVTKGNYDVCGAVRPKDSDDVFVETTEKSALELRLYRITPEGQKSELTGRQPVNTPTFAQTKTMNSSFVSDDGKNVLMICSDRVTSPDLYFAEATAQKPKEPIRVTNSPLPDYKKVKLVMPKEVTFAAPDGKTIHALLYVPSNIPVGTKCGAFLDNMYADSAKNRWVGFSPSYACENLGMVVLSVDFRSSYGYGSDFGNGYYRSLGQVDADEAVAAANYLKSLPMIDPARVGLWGWSYGGFLTEMVMCTRPGVFAAGVAGAPVTDWTHYNEWYTRHRLNLPKEDEEAYKKSSPVNFAAGLQGKLLMIHGMQDDNVLFQDTVQMVQKLIEAGKEFDVAFYPKDDHSVSRDETRPHVYTRIYKYLYMWLGGK